MTTTTVPAKARTTNQATKHTTVRPSFFVVGAPRCGTTALCQYLGQHPELYIPYVKEPHFFGSDLSTRRGFSTVDEYLELFEQARGMRSGEGSTWYLYSKRAAQEIFDFDPEAKIIVMLREPVQMLQSWHGHAVLRGHEDIYDFAAALDAEADRRQGKRLPKGSPIEKLLYSEVPLYADQLERYLKVFPREQVKVIVYDDFAADNLLTVRETYEFLGVDPELVPQKTVTNANGLPRSRFVQRFVEHQPAAVRRVVKALLPREQRTKLLDAVREANSQRAPRVALDAELEQRLRELFAPQVERVSEMLGRDLTHWNRPRSER